MIRLPNRTKSKAPAVTEIGTDGGCFYEACGPVMTAAGSEPGQIQALPHEVHDGHDHREYGHDGQEYVDDDHARPLVLLLTAGAVEAFSLDEIELDLGTAEDTPPRVPGGVTVQQDEARQSSGGEKPADRGEDTEGRLGDRAGAWS